mgnify:CR=1 FL=1
MLLDACQLADLALLRLHLLRQGPSLLLEGADVPLQALVLLHLLAQLCLAAGELPLQLLVPESARRREGTGNMSWGRAAGRDEDEKKGTSEPHAKREAPRWV